MSLTSIMCCCHRAEKYKREYEEKYIIYRRLYDDIEDTRLDFATFKREIERASNAPEKLQQVRSRIQMTYHAVHKRSKRMQKTFNVLHDELLTIKQHLKDFAEKAGQG
jgi:chromosome segregation ATPase